MTRARERAGFNVRQVEEILFPHISRSALVRLEALQDPPTDKKNRGRTALLLGLYGFELEEFGVSEDDLPPVIDHQAWRRLAALSTKWLTTATALARRAA
jgi:hypothetical protein